jgi:hypothetical protein
MHEGDLPWLYEVCQKRYSDKYDPAATEGWYRNIVLKTPLLFLPIRTDHAFTIAMLSCLPWTPSEFEVNIIMLCAEDGHMWDTLRLLRSSIEWARLRKASYWKICSETDYELGPLARRLGATELTSRYVMRL